MSDGPRDLTDRTTKAGLWVVAARLLARCLDLVILLVLARQLDPVDFGLVAMAMTAVLITEAVLELPLVACLVREPHPTEAMFHTAFTLALLRGIVLAVLLNAISWPLSVFYDEPRLPLLMAVLAFAPIIRGLTSPRMVIFMQRMDFTREFAVVVAGKLLALLVGTTIALTTKSYWAIAASTVAAPVGSNIMSYIVAPYRPRASLAEWPRFASLLGWNALSQLITALNWQMDRLLLGRFVPQATLGRFSVAKDLSDIPSQALIAPLAGPLMAAFANKTSSYERGLAYCKASNAVLALTGPVLITLGLLAGPLITIVFGANWLEAAPYLTALTLIALIHVPFSLMPTLAVVLDKAWLIAVRSACEFLGKAPAMLLGIAYFGVTGALTAQAIAMAIVAAVSLQAVKQMTDVSIRDQLLALWRTLTAMAALAALLLLLRPEVDAAVPMVELITRTIGSTAAGAAIYAACLYILWILVNRPGGIEESAIRTATAMARKLNGGGDDL